MRSPGLDLGLFWKQTRALRGLRFRFSNPTEKTFVGYLAEREKNSCLAKRNSTYVVGCFYWSCLLIRLENHVEQENTFDEWFPVGHGGKYLLYGWKRYLEQLINIFLNSKLLKDYKIWIPLFLNLHRMILRFIPSIFFNNLCVINWFFSFDQLIWQPILHSCHLEHFISLFLLVLGWATQITIVPLRLPLWSN